MLLNNAFPPSSPRRQNGAVLLISLIILVALTVLGVAALSGSRTQLKVSANQAQLDTAEMVAISGQQTTMALMDLRKDDDHNPLNLMVDIPMDESLVSCSNSYGALTADCTTSLRADGLAIKNRVELWWGRWNPDTSQRVDYVAKEACAGYQKGASECHMYEIRSTGWIENEPGEKTDEPEDGDVQVLVRQWPILMGPPNEQSIAPN